MWNIINKVTRKAEKSIHLPHTFKMNNKEVSIVMSAEAFNYYYLNMADDLHIEIDNGISPISLLKNAYQNDFSQMNIIPIPKGEIQSIICSVKANDSSEYDGVSTKIRKMCNSLISKRLSYICNKSIQTGVFTNRFKYAVVKPLFKNRDRAIVSNYAPVSLLPVFFKDIRKDYVQ